MSKNCIIYGAQGSGKSTLALSFLLASVKGAKDSIEDAPFVKAIVITDSPAVWEAGVFKKKRQAGGTINVWEAPGEVPKKKWVKMACKYFSAVYGLRGRQKSLLEEAALTASQPASFISIMGRLGELMEARSGSYIEDASIVLEALSKCSGLTAASSLFSDGPEMGAQEAFNRSGVYIIEKDVHGREGDFLYGMLLFACCRYPARSLPVVCVQDGGARGLFPDGCPVTDMVYDDTDPSRVLLLTDTELRFSRKSVRSSTIIRCCGGQGGGYVMGTVDGFAADKVPPMLRKKSSMQNLSIKFAQKKKEEIERSTE